MGQTLLLALCGLFFACIIGLIVGLMSVVKSRVCHFVSRVFVDLIRGVPMIVLAYFVYFGMPYLFNTILGIGGAATTKVVDFRRQRMKSSFNAKDLVTYLRDVDVYIEKRRQLLEEAYGK